MIVRTDNVVGCRATELYVDAERVPGPDQIASYVGFLERRGAREPLQYVLESTEFMSLPFRMEPGVFIPRPDTELLIERVEPYLRGPGTAAGRTVLDVCCGSGVVGISFAKRLPGVTVVAVDVCDRAVALTARNAALNGVEKRLRTVRADAVEFLSSSETRFDAIVSNPPYVPTHEIPSLAPEIRFHEPHLGLDGGQDGLDFYRRIVPHLRDSLKTGGIVAFEMAASQGADLSSLLQGAFTGIKIHEDYTGMDRVLVAHDR
jgi:release factor glutamine methyltransferase